VNQVISSDEALGSMGALRLPLLPLLLTLGWRKYALEAIIILLLSYFLFMIMFILHAIIVLSGNINTCVVYEQHRVPSTPLWTSSLINDG
jgi:hypothetical protein